MRVKGYKKIYIDDPLKRRHLAQIVSSTTPFCKTIKRNHYILRSELIPVTLSILSRSPI